MTQPIDTKTVQKIFVEDAFRRLNEAEELVRELKVFIATAQKLCPHDWRSDGEDPRSGNSYHVCNLCRSKKTE